MAVFLYFFRSVPIHRQKRTGHRDQRCEHAGGADEGIIRHEGQRIEQRIEERVEEVRDRIFLDRTGKAQQS